MTNPTDKRLIEEYIPIKAISAEASREKSIRHGHISTLHLWWARRPLVAARAAVFAALVSADAKPEIIDRETKEPMTITKFMIELCKWQVSNDVLNEARRLIREAYPDNPPKVLDMFAGGGSIPLEALRLGAEAYALDLNPVAHIIELATLVYPQKYGKQLAEDVRKWGEWVLERVRAEVGDLYPLIPDPEHTQERVAFLAKQPKQQAMFPLEKPEQLSLDDVVEVADPDVEDMDDANEEEELLPGDIPPGYLQPVAYLWTRTVTCPNPSCRATVPLVRQTWLKKKKGDNVALEMVPHPTENRMAFHVRRAADPADFGFDPTGFSQRGNSVCGRCGTTVTSDYVKIEGKAGRMAAQMMATVCVRSNGHDKAYLSPDDVYLPMPDEAAIGDRLAALFSLGLEAPDELLEGKAADQLPSYGITRYENIFTKRQLLTMLTLVSSFRDLHVSLLSTGYDLEYVRGIETYLAVVVDKMALRHNTLCTWATTSAGGRLTQAFGRQALEMVWDFAEANMFSGTSGDFRLAIHDTLKNVLALADIPGVSAYVSRSSADDLPYNSDYMDAVVTDPPYYDYISYSDLSDFFYVWLKRTVGPMYSEHFNSELTPKKRDAAAPFYRKETRANAGKAYERKMSDVFHEANRVLKHNGYLVIVYAHKTTAGWSTIINSIRGAGFELTEAWPLDTELTGHRKKDIAALASSIFLVARKRSEASTGYYTSDVQPEMRRVVRERVRFFLQPEVGVTGADLNIATVGAGLAPYTRYARVELPNGEELTAAAYLEEVQSEVVRVLLGEASKSDPATQYYIMGRQYYGGAQVDFDEANTLARAIGVELDTGASALTKGKSALVEKKGAKMRLLDYTERGADESLGIPDDQPKAPLIDVLHRLLWLVENDNGKISEFLGLAMPDKYLLRVAAQALGGRGLASEPTPGAVRDVRSAEQRAIDTLLASWRRIFDEGAML